MSKQYGRLAVLQLVKGEGGSLGRALGDWLKRSPAQGKAGRNYSSSSVSKCSNITVKKRKGNICTDRWFSFNIAEELL